MRNEIATHLEWLADKVRKKEPMDAATSAAIDANMEKTKESMNEILAAHGEKTITETPKVETPDAVEKAEDDAAKPFLDEPVDAIPEHETHIWKRGLLPGGRYVKTCTVGGEMENVTFDVWQTISDR